MTGFERGAERVLGQGLICATAILLALSDVCPFRAECPRRS